MPISGMPWWMWLLMPLVRALASVGVTIASVIADRRTVGTWPKSIGCRIAASRWTVRVTVERRRYVAGANGSRSATSNGACQA